MIANADDPANDIIPDLAVMRDLSRVCYRRELMAGIVNLCRGGNTAFNWECHQDEPFMNSLIAELKEANYRVFQLDFVQPAMIQISIF